MMLKDAPSLLDSSTTFDNLQDLVLATATLVGVFVMLGVAAAGVRYLMSPDDMSRKLPALQKNVVRIVGAGIGCALLVAGGNYMRAMEYFSDTEGMDAIRASAADTTGRPLSPDPSSGWVIESVYGIDKGFHQMVAAKAHPKNAGVKSWADVYHLIEEAEVRTLEQVLADEILKYELRQLGIEHFGDPVLYNEGLVREGSDLYDTMHG